MKKMLMVMLALVAWIAPVMAADEPTPADAPWTIYCQSFSGDMRAQQAKMTRDAMVKATGMKQWYVVHGEAESTLYYGHYRSTDVEAEEGKDRKDAQHAHEDIDKIRSLEDANKKRVFPLTVFVQTPQRPGSEGPPEWDLKRLPADKYWTIYVGVYQDNPLRRQAAVEAVKTLRDDNIEAYYLHDTNASMVCIGAWPASAVKEPDEAMAPKDNRNAEIMATQTPLSSPVGEFKRSDGTKGIVFSNKATILDESLQRMKDRYPDFTINGKWLGREGKDKAGKKVVIGNKSQLFKIPHPEEATATARRTDGPPVVDQAIQQVRPAPTAPKGGSTLKRLKEND